MPSFRHSSHSPLVLRSFAMRNSFHSRLLYISALSLATLSDTPRQFRFLLIVYFCPFGSKSLVSRVRSYPACIAFAPVIGAGLQALFVFLSSGHRPWLFCCPLLVAHDTECRARSYALPKGTALNVPSSRSRCCTPSCIYAITSYRFFNPKSY